MAQYLNYRIKTLTKNLIDPNNNHTAILAPVIILIEPQLGENIGMCARAMLNCGLNQLRIVNPRDGWPNESAVAAAAGANEVLQSAQIHKNIKNAIWDLNYIFATTARPRGMVKQVKMPWDAVFEIYSASLSGIKTGIMFGRESMGLSNDEIALANSIVAVPLNPNFNSLNLAQAVLVLGYEWNKLMHGKSTPKFALSKEGRIAIWDDLFQLFKHLEEELDKSGFLRVDEKRPTMVRNIRNMLTRVSLTEQEVRTLRGIITSLVKYSGKEK